MTSRGVSVPLRSTPFGTRPEPPNLHRPDAEQRDTAVDVAEWAMARLTDRGAARPAPGAPTRQSLPSIGPSGIGTENAWAVLRDRVLPTAAATDHPRYLAFVAGAATVSSVIADMAVSAASVYAGSELEGGAVVAAERAALRWLADLIGLPAGAHGAFVSGGSMANLSALVVARDTARRRSGQQPGLIIAGAGGHSSLRAAAGVMGCDVVTVGDPDRPLTAQALGRALQQLDPTQVAAVAATAGATNTGAIDELEGIATVCAAHGVWLHVDAAYGGAALLSDRTRPAFAGIAAADSVTIDPHKWLFTPFDCGAVIYRDPGLARASHAQTAPYLDVVSAPEHDNPADYALHLSRRARGVPLWMSLLAHGTDAYARAVETCLDRADYAAGRIRENRVLSLAADPSLSTVVFRRRGWRSCDYASWSASARRRAVGLITPTTVRGAAALRLCFVNPQTSNDDVDLVLDDVASFVPEDPARG